MSLLAAFMLDVVALVLWFSDPGSEGSFFLTTATLVAMPVWWVWHVIDRSRTARCEVAVTPAAIPGVMGEPFRARIEVTMPDGPAGFVVSLSRPRRSKSDHTGFWGESRVSTHAVRKVDHEKYEFDIEIPVAQVKKCPGREWVLGFEAKCARFASHYFAYFVVLMDEDQPYANPPRELQPAVFTFKF